MKVRMIHTEAFGLLPINYQGLSTEQWLYIKIQSKANHHSLTCNDYQWAGGKTCDNPIRLVNPTFPTLRIPNHHGFICLQTFEKNPFCTSRQESRSLHLPRPPGVELFTAVALGRSRHWQEQKELCSYPTVLPRGESYPAMYCNAEPKEQPNQRLCYASVSVRTKILCFTATMQLYACLSNGGITVMSQNCPWKVIISDLTIRFALYAVLKT